MPASNLPDPIEKRDQIYGDSTDTEDLRELGNRFFEHGHLPDALEAYVEGDIEKGAKKVLEKAREQGNYFLINTINEQWPQLVNENTWKTAGENAEDAGRLTDAVKLYYAGDFSGDLNRAEEKLEDELGHAIPAVVRADTADAKEKDQLEDED